MKPAAFCTSRPGQDLTTEPSKTRGENQVPSAEQAGQCSDSKLALVGLSCQGMMESRKAKEFRRQGDEPQGCPIVLPPMRCRAAPLPTRSLQGGLLLVVQLALAVLTWDCCFQTTCYDGLWIARTPNYRGGCLKQSAG